MANGEGVSRPKINNDFYDDLGDAWYDDDEHPVALLRKESETKVDYICNILSQTPSEGRRVADIACGAGFLALPLARKGYAVRGIDLSEGSIDVAKRHSRGIANLDYEVGSAYQLPWDDQTFDIALMMDCLEHFDDPRLALKEAARILKPGGLLFYHTFNRTLLGRLLAVHAIEWFAKQAPKHIHVYHMFIKPQELGAMLRDEGMQVAQQVGLGPKFNWSLLKTIVARRLCPGFEFEIKRSIAVGYMGYAKKLERSSES